MTTLAVTLRTAPRPTVPYLGRTVRSLIAGGLAPEALHVFPTGPDVAWMRDELGDLPVCRHVPTEARHPNANGVAQVSVLDEVSADWLLMLEDDIEVCADFPGSVVRWLERHATPDIAVYRFCAWGQPLRMMSRAAVAHSLREQRGSQAVALRAAEARDFARWATEHHEVWRPARAPFQNQRTNGFDKLVGYWALATRPGQDIGLVSRPHFVRHIGTESSLHRTGPLNPYPFAPGWSYQGIA